MLEPSQTPAMLAKEIPEVLERDQSGDSSVPSGQGHPPSPGDRENDRGNHWDAVMDKTANRGFWDFQGSPETSSLPVSGNTPLPRPGQGHRVQGTSARSSFPWRRGTAGHSNIFHCSVCVL